MEQSKAEELATSAEARSWKEELLAPWQSQSAEAIRPLLRGCAFEVLSPDGFFSAWRMADRLARPYSMHATVDFLQSTLNISPGRLRAVIAPFYDQWLEEYRVSFTLKERDNVLYGLVWALVGDEDENTDTVAQIEATLRECGVIETTSAGRPLSTGVLRGLWRAAISESGR